MIPPRIQIILDSMGLNNANTFELNGITYWSLELIYDIGNTMPIGQPIIYAENEDKLIRLTEQQTNELLEKLQDE